MNTMPDELGVRIYGCEELVFICHHQIKSNLAFQKTLLLLLVATPAVLLYSLSTIIKH